MTRLDYQLVDVFTRAPFTGNPLAVVLGGESLTAGQRQALAGEFHLSETAFPVRPSRPEADYRLFIHTPEEELPFAGHPSVGTAWVLRAAGRFGTAATDIAATGTAATDIAATGTAATGSLDSRATVTQECGAGLLPVRFLPSGAVELTGATPWVGGELEPGPLRAAAGLPSGAGLAAFPAPRRAGTGIEFAVLPVSAAELDTAAPDSSRLRALGGTGLVLVHWQSGRADVRVFAGGVGVAEDPATGSAATALMAYLVAAGLLPADGASAVAVTQGRHVGRPSELAASVLARSGVAVECRVAGEVVPVGAGQIEIPPA